MRPILKKSFISFLLALLLVACGPTATFILPTPTFASPTPFVAQVSTEPPTATQPSIATTTPVLAASPTTVVDISKMAIVASPDIQILDMKTIDSGWALAGTGVLRTSNGGDTWRYASPDGVTSRPNTAFFLNEAIAWVLTGGADLASGSLHHTIDGGATWSSIQVPFGDATLSFTDGDNGWALASLGYALSHQAVAVYRTSDAGLTWTQVFTDDPTAANTSDSLPFAGDKSGLTAVDHDHAWVAGSEPVSDFIYLFSTSDGGKTWSGLNPALPADFAGAMTNSDPPTFFSVADGVLPVKVYANSSAVILYITHDGGKSWNATTPVTQNGRVSLASLTDFFVWDGGPVLSVSHDGGKTWSSVNTNVNFPNDLVSFQFASSQIGWAITSDANGHYKLYQTANGGSIWNILIP